MRSFVVALLGLALTVLPACTSRAVTPERDTGTGATGDTGTHTDTGPFDPFHDANYPDMGLSSGDCSAASQLIYLVDSNNAFLSYQPGATPPLHVIGTVHCAGALVTPFSMAVSRDAVAYVLHSDHHIYAVSTTDASCTPTTFAIDQMGFQQFGMGFVSDDVGSTAETLFIAGGSAIGIGGGSSTLGSIRLADWRVSTIGPLSGSPELTGNGLGELWGFFPDTTPMAVRQLDKTNGGRIQEFDVSSIDTSSFHHASAWAFAYWGGRYYMFYQGSGDTSTGIYSLTPDTGVVAPVMRNIGYRIVGAGVSTCAPTILI